MDGRKIRFVVEVVSGPTVTIATALNQVTGERHFGEAKLHPTDKRQHLNSEIIGEQLAIGRALQAAGVEYIDLGNDLVDQIAEDQDLRGIDPRYLTASTLLQNFQNFL